MIHDKNYKKHLLFSWLMAFAGLIGIVSLCHAFAGYARFSEVSLYQIHGSYYRINPVIISLNVFLILSIIVCLRIRTLGIVRKQIKSRMKSRKQELQEDVVQAIYLKSIRVSNATAFFIGLVGLVFFFLTHDYLVPYLFLVVGFVFLVINRPKEVDIYNIKEALKLDESGNGILFEKNRSLRIQLRFAFLMLLLFPVTCSYLEYRNVDPEGACKSCKNIGRCLEAWGAYSEYFRPLPSDDEMIKLFRNHRQQFEEMVKDADTVERRQYIGTRAIYGYLDKPWWIKKYSPLGFSNFESLCHIPSDIHSIQKEYYEGFSKNSPDKAFRPVAFAFET